jgi:hypothetical protein
VKKDRLVQTRVPRELEDRIKEEAERRRVTVSQLVRNLLEDTVDLVDGVLGSVDGIVAGSVELAGSVSRDAVRVARAVTRGTRRLTDEGSWDLEAEVPPAHRDRAEPEHRGVGEDCALDHIAAWNPVVLNRAIRCSSCAAELARGDRAYAGLGEGPIAWLCEACLDEL